MAVAESTETFVGSSVKRKEDLALLVGQTTWVDNMAPPGTLYMAVVRSPYPHARITSVNLDAARAAEGVVAAFSGADLQDDWASGLPCAWPVTEDIKMPPHYPLATDEARFQGDGVAVVVAESRVLVAVTNSDERNLLISLLGKQLGIPRIVTRAGSAVNERLFERVGIDVVRSAQGTAIQAVLSDLIGGRSRLLAEVEHGDARVLQIDVPEGMPARRLKEMHAPVFAIVGAIHDA